MKFRNLVGTVAIAAMTSTLLITGSGAALASTVAPAQAADDLGTSEQSMIEVWTDYGVPAETQTALLEKLADGIALDSMTGENLVSQEQPDGTEALTISRFGDGSIAISTVTPTASSGVQARGVSGCVANTTTYARDCKVDGWVGPVKMSFIASYTKVDRKARVYDWKSASWDCSPGSCDRPTFELIREFQLGESPAQISLVTNYNWGVGNTSVRLSLFAKDRSAWSG
jgi:hypothetical protein